MPTILQVHNDTATRLAQFPRWTDLVELDSAVAETYSVPADADTILINPVKQSDGSATSVYAMWGTNAIGSVLHIIAINDTEWYGISVQGTWTLS